MKLHPFFPGEMHHGDATDEESLDDKNRTDSWSPVSSLSVSPPPPPRPLGKSTSTMTLEMLVRICWDVKKLL